MTRTSRLTFDRFLETTLIAQQSTKILRHPTSFQILQHFKNNIGKQKILFLIVNVTASIGKNFEEKTCGSYVTFKSLILFFVVIYQYF